MDRAPTAEVPVWGGGNHPVRTLVKIVLAGSITRLAAIFWMARRIEHASRNDRRTTIRVQPFGQNLYEKTQTADSKDDLKHEPKMENKTAN